MTIPTIKSPRLGIDLGGTKIEGVVLAADGTELARLRIPTPRQDYRATVLAIRDLGSELMAQASVGSAPTGIAIPGSISKTTGLMQNANSTWLNGKPFGRDLCDALGQDVRLANDANCFARSEATDGAAAGANSVFGVILGTGVGGGLVVKGNLIDGPLGIGGEWGHNPLPWTLPGEVHGPLCWCGRQGCMEAWVSGPALAADHARVTGRAGLSAEAIVEAAQRGDAQARATLARHQDRLARGLAHVVNIVDPEMIVLGGGLSKLTHLYDTLPSLMRPHVFSDTPAITICPPKWGDASGVRGAAWLAGP